MTDAREYIAARLARLARLVRQSPVTDVTTFDDAYRALVEFAGSIRHLTIPQA